LDWGCLSMKMWLDCEFNGWNGELISMALVTADGHEFYEVLRCQEPVEWVAKNVMPILGKAPVPKHIFTDNLQVFLCAYAELTIIADWPDDIAYFCKALITAPGECINTPPLTFQIVRDLPPEAYAGEFPHNALSDARQIRSVMV
jgi:hypothetical protein